MSIDKLHNPYDLPPDLAKRYHEVEQNFFGLLQTGQFNDAKKAWGNLYELFLKKQEELEYRLHKGGIVHNLGIVALLTNNIELAFKNFILGFAEDVASQEQGFLKGEAEGAPGAQNLKTFFGVGPELFNLVRNIIKERVAESNFNDPRKTFKGFWETQIGEKTLKEKIDFLKKTPFIIQKKYHISSPPGEWTKRVFVGGNYSGERVGNLFEIKKAVERKGYTPIVALEFDDEEPVIHDHSLLLLHNCKYAIFDVSKDSGYLMEVERTLDYRTETLLVYQKIAEERMTAMITSLRRDLKEFSNNQELNKLIDSFLP